MASTIEKVKDALHLNKHHGTISTTGTTGTNHSAGTTHGTTNSGVGEGQAGPHSSRVANAADPRVDSDLDGRGAGAGSTGYTGTTGNTTHGTGMTGAGTGAARSTNAGPHSSNLANKMDPRVDSDMDGRAGGAGVGSTGYTGTAGNTTHGTGMTGAGTGAAGSTNAGPHSSNLANKMDPRVDSDMDGSRNMGAASHAGTTQTTTGTGTGGYGGTHAGNNLGGNTGTTGGLSNSTNAGPHDSNLANKADPRVDSDLDGRGNRHGAATGGIMGTTGSHATPGSGTAQNTAGPHNSDLANKLDPRVDADMDGSKTYGGNKTHADTHNLDASKVPPSVFAARKGEPEVLHGDHTHKHAGRHGTVVSNQDQLSGV